MRADGGAPAPDRGALDWPGLMRVGLGVLRLTPAEFWALTPAELRLMLGQGGAAGGPMTRSGLETLAARFPDRVPAADPGPARVSSTPRTDRGRGRRGGGQ